MPFRPAAAAMLPPRILVALVLSLPRVASETYVVFHPKTPESKAIIVQALSKHYLFGKLSDQDKSDVADAMQVSAFLAGDSNAVTVLLY